MAKATEKHPDIDAFVNHLSGGDRVRDIAANRCVPAPVGCGGPATEFRNAISQREYTISGFCQKCQDSIFGVD